MGTNSKLYRYRDAGEEANVNNVERFGKPVRSLFASTKVLAVNYTIEITDDDENIVYVSHSKVISAHDKTYIADADGNKICTMERKLNTMHPKRVITMSDGNVFEVKAELMHFSKEVYNIAEFGWKLQGNIMELNFELLDENNQIIAVIGQKALSLHKKCSIDIYNPEYEHYVVAIVVAIQHILASKRRVAVQGA